MPITGPEGQGPFETFEECVDAMADEEGVDDPEALCAFWEDLDKNQTHAMTDTNDEPQYRAYYQADPADITVREIDDEEDGLFAIRMPIASTGEVRNEGDEPLTRDEVEGMARQINEQDVGVFLGHGMSDMITGERFGQTERLGNWRDAEIQTREDRDEDADDDLLFASAELMDPDTLPNIGPIRDALGTLKEQAKRGIGISSSIGWSEAEGEPGGNDLMEASIVGIPADPRTVTQSGPAAAVARAAVEAGADPEALVDAVRSVVMEPESGDRDASLNEEWSEALLADPGHLEAYVEEHGGQRFLDGFREWLEWRETNDMTDEPDPDDEQSGTDDDESTEEERQDDVLEQLLELQEAQMDVLQSIDEAVREDDDDDEEEDDDEDENATDEDDDEEDEDDEQSADADTDDEQAADEVADLREQLRQVRDGELDPADLDLPDESDERTADEEDDETDDQRDADTGDADPNEDATKAVLR